MPTELSRAWACLLASGLAMLAASPLYAQAPPAGVAIAEIHLDAEAPDASFIELVQLGTDTVSLDGFQLTTSPDYATGIVAGDPVALLALPADLELGPGARLIIAGPDADAFTDAWGRAPDVSLEIGLDTVLADEAGLLVLAWWDGRRDLVADADLVRWGSGGPAVDKTGLLVDGPDDDAAPSRYGADTAVGQQEPAGALRGRTLARVAGELGEDIRLDANGLDGHDETSERWSSSFLPTRAATPGEPNRIAFRVSGVVRGPDGEPIVGATVRQLTTGLRASTDETGAFVLPAVTLGPSVLYVDALGTDGLPLSTQVAIDLVDDDLDDLVVDLAPGLVVSGRIALRDLAPPALAGTRVEAPTLDLRTETDGDGDFSLGGLPARPVTLAITRDGFRGTQVTVDPSAAQRLELELRPAVMHRVELTLRSGGGPLPADTRIALLGLDGQPDVERRTDTVGEPVVALQDVLDGRYRLRIEALDFETVELGPLEVDRDLALVVELVPRITEHDGEHRVSCAAVSHRRPVDGGALRFAVCAVLTLLSARGRRSSGTRSRHRSSR